jgi:2'-5' RNA ligase
MQVERLRLPPAPPRVRVFAHSDLHVTLGFLGSVQEADARKAWALIDRFGSFRQVTGSFAGVKPLGNPRKPSALSAIVDTGREALSEMIVEARSPLLDAAGARPDTREPLPHMTLARVQRRASADERRAALRWALELDTSKAKFSAPSVALYTWSDDRQNHLFRIVEHYVLPVTAG